MSTKIYNAYHVKDSQQLWPVLRKIKKLAHEECKKKLIDAYDKLMKAVDPNSEEYKKLDDVSSDTYCRLRMVEDLIRTGYKNQLGSMERNPFHLDTSITIHENEGQYYLIAYCDWVSLVAGSLDFLENMEELEDFHYQNSTDKPDEISDEDWARREKIWDEIHANDWRMQLHLEIVSYDGFYWVDPYWDSEHIEKYRLIIDEERAESRRRKNVVDTGSSKDIG